MELVNEYFVQEVTYRYNDSKEEEFHKNYMGAQGFRAVSDPLHFKKELRITYQKRVLNDKIARF